MNLKIFIAAGAALVLLAGCTTTSVIDANSTPARKLSDVAEERRLDIGVALFDPNVPFKQKQRDKKFINPDVRRAEASVLPYLLRDTLQNTENWGAVRVLPRTSQSVDLMVYGRIDLSNGRDLQVTVVARDSTGREWLEETYFDQASSLSYRAENAAREDAFQDLYNRIADDLLLAYEALQEEEIDRIRATTSLRFAADLAPDAFGGFLAEDEDGQYQIVRLPADGDPMLTRVEKIRLREHQFIDVLDDYYGSLHEEIGQPYGDWRRYSYEETVSLEEMRRTATLTKVMGAAMIVGGMAVSGNADSWAEDISGQLIRGGGIQMVMGGFDLGRASRIHADTLRELSESFGAESKSMIVEIEGEIVELSGTADEQFTEWRSLLREIYRSETGLATATEPPRVTRPGAASAD